MDQKLYNSYVKILKNELVPALGCTEPIAIAYAAAKAHEVLGQMPEKIELCCSGNIIKNVKGVKVPNSNGLKGIDVAATLGVVGGRADRELEVLEDVTEADIEKTKELVQQGFCTCIVKGRCRKSLYRCKSHCRGTQRGGYHCQPPYTDFTHCKRR